MEFKDYYKVLGIDPSATPEEIKKTYKKLARKYHPDVSDESDAQARFQEVSEAYEVLKDKEKRAEYDELRAYVNNPNQFKQAGGGHFFNFDSNFSADDQFEDLLKSIFGGRAGFGGAREFNSAQFSQRGRDIRHKLHISLEDAYHGGSRHIRLGTMQGEKTINVKIPKGIARGQELRLKGQGEPGIGKAEPGDLFLEIDFESHPLFDVDGKDVTLVLPVAPWEAALGATVEVPTLGGKVNLKVPPDSQNGHKLRLGGRGLGTGDQIVVLRIINPPVRTDAEKEAFAQLHREFSFNPREKMGMP